MHTAPWTIGPTGGGPGMVLKAEPMLRAIRRRAMRGCPPEPADLSFGAGSAF